MRHTRAAGNLQLRGIRCIRSELVRPYGRPGELRCITMPARGESAKLILVDSPSLIALFASPLGLPSSVLAALAMLPLALVPLALVPLALAWLGSGRCLRTCENKMNDVCSCGSARAGHHWVSGAG